MLDDYHNRIPLFKDARFTIAYLLLCLSHNDILPLYLKIDELELWFLL